MESIAFESQWLSQQFWVEEGLDRLARLVALRLPDCIALVDELGDEGRERSLTFAELDTLVGQVALQLYDVELPDQSLIAIRMANRIEALVSLLACWRSGHAFVYIPEDWNRFEIAQALAGHNVSALIFHSEDDPSSTNRAYAFAEDVGTLRQVFAFGVAADGMINLGDIETSLEVTPCASSLPSTSGFDIAQLGWSAGKSGWEAFIRLHNNLRAQGLSVAKSVGLKRGAKVTTLMHPLGACGLASATIPWLLTAGTLRLISEVQPAVLRRGLSVSDLVVAPHETLDWMARQGLFNDRSNHLCLARVVSPAGSQRPLGDHIKNRVVDLHNFNNLVVAPLVHKAEDQPPLFSLSNASTRSEASSLIEWQGLIVKSDINRLELFATGAAIPFSLTSQDHNHGRREPDDAPLLRLGYAISFSSSLRMITRCSALFPFYARGGQIISLASLDLLMKDVSGIDDGLFFLYGEDQSRLGLAIVPSPALNGFVDPERLNLLLKQMALTDEKKPDFIHVTSAIPRKINGDPDRTALARIAAQDISPRASTLQQVHAS